MRAGCFVGAVFRVQGADGSSPARALFALQHAVQFPTGFPYSLIDADRLSTRLITWRRTARLGILAIALMIATPSFEAA